MKIIKIIFKAVIIIFAIIGFILSAGFFAVKYNLTNVMAVVDSNNDRYSETANAYENAPDYSTLAVTTSADNLKLNNVSNKISQLQTAEANLATWQKQEKINLCQLQVIGDIAPENAKNIAMVYKTNKSLWVFEQMILAVSLRLDNNQDFKDKLVACKSSDNNYPDEDVILSRYDKVNEKNIFAWSNNETWPIVSRAILKDKAVIESAAAAAEVDPRTIVSILLVEQLRLYNTQREYYEKFFKPLEILANANKMAWGVMAIKEKSAIDIENNLKNSGGQFYPGITYANLLDFTSPDTAKERYNRLTDSHNHYYSYLYGALLIKEIEAQWQKQGYDISKRPEVLATLFNIGFMKSKPKDDPQVGGSITTLNGVDYTFGSLAHEFYYSNLLPEFPVK